MIKLIALIVGSAFLLFVFSTFGVVLDGLYDWVLSFRFEYLDGMGTFLSNIGDTLVHFPEFELVLSFALISIIVWGLRS